MSGSNLGRHQCDHIFGPQKAQIFCKYAKKHLWLYYSTSDGEKKFAFWILLRNIYTKLKKCHLSQICNLRKPWILAQNYDMWSVVDAVFRQEREIVSSYVRDCAAFPPRFRREACGLSLHSVDHVRKDILLVHSTYPSFPSPSIKRLVDYKRLQEAILA